MLKQGDLYKLASKSPQTKVLSGLKCIPAVVESLLQPGLEDAEGDHDLRRAVARLTWFAKKANTNATQKGAR